MAAKEVASLEVFEHRQSQQVLDRKREALIVLAEAYKNYLEADTSKINE